jgi:hypothetical protein
MHPCRSLTAAWLVEVGELADMVHRKMPLGVTALAALGEEPVDPLVAPGAGHDRRDVGEDGRALPVERAPAEAGDQRLPAPIALDGDLPSGVSIVALYVRAICMTVARCLRASVFSREVAMTPWSVPRRKTS